MTTRDEVHIQDQSQSQSLGSLVSRMAGDLGDIVRKEVELAKIEIKDEVSQASKAGGMFGGAAIAANMALLFVSIALALLLDKVMTSPLAFAIVGVVYAIAALVLAKSAQAKMKRLKTLPETKETIKEDVQWAKTRNS
jgi:uncharacterized membrane protein YqjE